MQLRQNGSFGRYWNEYYEQYFDLARVGEKNASVMTNKVNINTEIKKAGNIILHFKNINNDFYFNKLGFIL